MKAFRVVVSEACRKQNRPLHTFDVQCEANQSAVYAYYCKKYEGLVVNVNELLILKLPNTELESFIPCVPAIKKTTSIEIKKLELTDEEQRQLGLIAERQRNLSSAKKLLSEAVSKRIIESNKLLYKNCCVTVNLKGDLPHIETYGVCTVSATIYLNGDLMESLLGNLSDDEEDDE